MASHTELPYTTITGRDPVNEALDSTGHYSGHVNILGKVKGKTCVFMGHNKRHGNVATFGGFSEPGEKLIDTIKRKTAEESLDCIMTGEELENRIRKDGVLVTRKSSRGRHYTAFIDLGPEEFPFKAAQELFHRKSKAQDALTKGQRENGALHAIEWETLKKDDDEEMTNVHTSAIDGVPVWVRGITMPAYRHAFPLMPSWW